MICSNDGDNVDDGEDEDGDKDGDGDDIGADDYHREHRGCGGVVDAAVAGPQEGVTVLPAAGRHLGQVQVNR